MSEKAGRPVKVLQVIHGLGMGGAETWLMEALRLWAQSGEVKCDFLLTSGGEGIFDAEARALGAGRASRLLPGPQRHSGRLPAHHDHHRRHR